MTILPESFLPPTARRRVVLLLAATFFCSTAVAQIEVAFLAPDPPGRSAFWTQTITVMEAAAEDLGVNLTITYSKSNNYSNRKDGMALLDGADTPDYFLTGYWPGSTEHLLEHTKRTNIKFFVFNAGAGETHRNEVGRPRGKYPNWIGQMTPDDRRAGYDLADALIRRAKSSARTDGTIHVVGIGGLGNASSDDDRQYGLNQRIKEGGDAVLDRFLFAEWSQEVARDSLLEILEPETPVSVFWSSGDSMAMGAVEAARALNKTPGNDIFIGGVGASRQALKSITTGDMAVVFGGHFLEGAWALVLLHDYHNGHDFADDLGTEFHTQYMPFTVDNAQDYLDKIASTDWSTVDFRQFSKIHNPKLKKYRWPLDAVLAQLQARDADE